MSAMQRRKGKDGELEVAQMIRAAIPSIDAQRSYHQSRKGDDAPDVDTPALPMWLEVKRHAQPNIRAAVRQAVDDSKGKELWPVAFTRGDRDGWLVTMPADDWLDLVREWWERGQVPTSMASRDDAALIARFGNEGT